MKTLVRRGVFLVFLYLGHLCFAESSIPVSWEKLGELNYESGEMSESLSQLNNQIVEVSGFIVPLEMDGYIDTVKEFLLVPNPLACIHVPPPPPNQMVFIKMKKSIPLDMDFRGVAIRGLLTISKPKKENSFVSYEIEGFFAKEANIEVEDPMMEFLQKI